MHLHMLKSIRILDVLIIIVVVVSFFIILHSYEQAEKNLKEILLKNQIELQYGTNKAIAMSMESDLNSIAHELYEITQYYQTNDYLINEQAKITIEQKFENINKIATTKTFFQTDKEFK